LEKNKASFQLENIKLRPLCFILENVFVEYNV
jgi:hypothetical protein